MTATRAKPAALFRIEGTIREMDTVSRLLAVLVHEVSKDLVVPPDCLIRLNGERVKMRLLQAGDRVEVSYSHVGGVAYAHSVQVHWLPRVVKARAGNSGRGVALCESNCPGSEEGLP